VERIRILGIAVIGINNKERFNIATLLGTVEPWFSQQLTKPQVKAPLTTPIVPNRRQ
jgi:hypothetical protein